MAENMTGDIISDHRERMLNLKKYYPFFRLIDTSFSNYKDGRYEILDMGYIVMAVLRFFIEENNFKEKDVTYPEYLDFLRLILKRDFGLELNEEDSKDIADYIFDKIKNEGKPFEFSYYDPVDRKKRVSRMKIIESSIRDNTVWYSISPDAIEFYLDTKEIKDESRISVSQLLLEKMINSQNFRGGVEVVERINEEVNRLKLKKNEVMTILAGDVFAGIEAYEEFVKTGMKWFQDEEKLFKKNRDLIAKSIEKLNASGSTGEGYYRTINEIYNLETQLKQAMNRHSELLRDCTEMQKMTDEAVKRAKLGRLRSHMDFTAALSDLIKKDDADILVTLLSPLLKPNIRKTFNLMSIDDALMVKPPRYEEKEKVSGQRPEDIVFEDELEEQRIRDNYVFLMKNLVECLKKSDILTLGQFAEIMKKAYGDRILKNADFFSFFVNLCQKDEYSLGAGAGEDTFLDSYMEEGFKDSEAFTFVIRKCMDGQIVISEDCMMADVEFKRKDTDGEQESR